MGLQQTPVLIVGGGEIGLATSILLSQYHIPHLLLERQPTTSIYPKAISLHNRTVEILRCLGVLSDALAISAPPETFQRTTWLTSLGPEGKVIANREAFGYVLNKGERGEAYRRASPCAYMNVPQIRLEPVLRKRAEGLNPGGLWFHHDVTAVVERGNEAVVTYHARSGQEEGIERTIVANYVIGADGGRFLTEHLGLQWEGESDILDMVNAHIRAPMSRHLPDFGCLINWFVNPRLQGSVNSGVLYHLGPYPTDPQTEEWSVVLARLPHERSKPFTKEDLLTRLRKIFQIPGLDIEILAISHWFLQAKAASSFISPGGRVFLVGDAAHRVPPWGAFGANTGFADVQNLIWKLALALKPSEELGDLTGLLESYDAERRPIGQRVARMGLFNMRSHGLVLDRALGVSPTQSEDENVKAVEMFFDDEAEGEAKISRDEKREAVRKGAQETLDIEFYALGAEAGWFYDHSDICDNEEWSSPQVNADGQMEPNEYRPCTVPGHQLPHAWLTNTVGERTSTRWLVKQAKLLLLTGSSCWRAVEHEMVDLVVLDEDCWQDSDGTWAEQREVAPSGAVLVRPDNIVAYRWKDGAMLKRERDPSAELDRVVRRVLRSGARQANGCLQTLSAKS